MGSNLAFANPYNKPIGIQLFTVRDLMAKDPEGTLKKLAEIGYKEFEADADTIFKLHPLLKQLGLQAPSTHYRHNQVKADWEKEVERAKAADVKYMVDAYIDGSDRKNLADLKKIVELFHQAGEQCHKAGIQFCYHNHNFEFRKVDGEVMYDFLLRETDPKLVKFELDCGWITRAGYDPAEYMHKYPGRFPLLHIKDIKAGLPPATSGASNANGAIFAELGRGVVNWKSVFAAAKKGGLKHYFVEEDECDVPVLEAVKINYDYLHNLKL
jgi:sugar phosphate isomerase/epimerase